MREAISHSTRGVAELQRAEGHVDRVAGHVAEGAGAEIIQPRQLKV
jgi:hypothetical protein